MSNTERRGTSCHTIEIDSGARKRMTVPGTHQVAETKKPGHGYTVHISRHTCVSDVGEGCKWTTMIHESFCRFATVSLVLPSILVKFTREKWIYMPGTVHRCGTMDKNRNNLYHPTHSWPACRGRHSHTSTRRTILAWPIFGSTDDVARRYYQTRHESCSPPACELVFLALRFRRMRTLSCRRLIIIISIK